MPTLAPQRDFDTHDVINQYRFNPTGTYPVTKGTFVRPFGSGIVTNTSNLIMLGPVGAAYANSVSQRYGVYPSVAQITDSGDIPLGMLLYDVREVDENGEKLIFHPDKAAQMQVSISGQPVPIVTRGWFVYSGVNGTPRAGEPAYLYNDGGLTAVAAGTTVTATRVGTFLGEKDPNGFVYVKIAL
jgi:hypothetical protein